MADLQDAQPHVMFSINCRTMTVSALKAAKLLGELGVRAWVCVEMNGGVNYREEIVKAVKGCSVFVPLINKPWAESGECLDEYNLAKKLNQTTKKPVIMPIAFKDLVWDKYPHVEMLASYCNFIVHNGNTMVEGDFDDTFNKLVSALRPALKQFGVTVANKVDLKKVDEWTPADVSGLVRSLTPDLLAGFDGRMLCALKDSDVAEETEKFAAKLYEKVQELKDIETKANGPVPAAELARRKAVDALKAITPQTPAEEGFAKVKKIQGEYAKNATVVAEALNAIQNLASTKKGIKHVVAQDGFKIAIAALRGFPKEASVVLNALSLLYKLVQDAEENQLISSGAMQAAMEAMKKYRSHARIQEQGCNLIGQAANSGEGTKALMKAKVLGIINAAMKQHSKDPEVLYAGLWALGCLASDEDNVGTIMDHQVMETVYTAIKENPEAPYVQEWGLEVIWHCCYDKQQILKKSLNYIYTAMEKHRSQGNVQEKAIKLLACLIEDDNNKGVVMFGDGVKKVLESMRACKAEPEVQQQALNFLAELAGDEDRAALLVEEEGLLEAVFTALDEHIDEPADGEEEEEKTETEEEEEEKSSSGLDEDYAAVQCAGLQLLSALAAHDDILPVVVGRGAVSRVNRALTIYTKDSSTLFGEEEPAALVEAGLDFLSSYYASGLREKDQLEKLVEKIKNSFSEDSEVMEALNVVQEQAQRTGPPPADEE